MNIQSGVGWGGGGVPLLSPCFTENSILTSIYHQVTFFQTKFPFFQPVFVCDAPDNKIWIFLLIHTCLYSGALLKSVFLCTNTISLSSVSSLTTQLQERHGCGFELHTWSHLPHGSGLGTSSILAGVICAAVLRILGLNHDNKTLVHLVIHVEQMLTSGGGWQDQVGGLLPGVKMTTSAPEIPIMVKPKQLNLSNDTLCKVAHHTALIYTGKTRLAKYILQVSNRTKRDTEYRVQLQEILAMKQTQ